MVKNEPIKLQNNLYLYSGDIITINDSNPLLVEINDAENKTIKLRNIKNNKYLSKNRNPFFKSLNFLTDFENAPIFTVGTDNNDKKIILQVNSKCLKSKEGELSLSSKERWLTITKQQNIKDIANYEETVEDIKFDEKKEKEISTEKSLIVRDFHDNKSGNASKHTFKFTESIQNEHTFTSSADFTWGVSADFKLGYSSTVVGFGGKLEEKITISDTVKRTEVATSEKSLEVVCSPWKKMRVKSETKKTKSLTPYTANVKRVIGGRIYECLINGERFCEESLCHNSFNEEITVRNILIVGWTGSGKSTLAKVLSGDNKFEESDGSTPGTKFFQKSNEFEWEGNYYSVIDNIGFGDTKVSEKETLIRIGEAINSAYQGLSHVLFVFAGRFSDQEKEGFQKLSAFKIINSFITVVRSRFDNFGNKKACEKDRESLEKEGGPEISQVFNNCRGLLHIDNDKKDKDSCKNSREKVLNYLHNNCTGNPFKPEEWENIVTLIEDYLKEKEKLESEKSQANIDRKEEIEQKEDKLDTNIAENVREEMKGKAMSEFTAVIEVTKK